MNAVQRALLSNGPEVARVVDEFFTEATIEALNAELLRRDVAPEQVISILPVAARIMAKPVPPQFRVLYRAN